MRYRVPVILEVESTSHDYARRVAANAARTLEDDRTLRVFEVGEAREAATPPNPEDPEFAAAYAEAEPLFPDHIGAGLLRVHDIQRKPAEQMTQSDYGFLAGMADAGERRKRELNGILLSCPATGKPMVEMTEETF